MKSPAASIAAAVDGDALVALARDAVRIPSITPNERPFADWVKTELEESGWNEVDLVEVAPGRPNVYSLTGEGEGRSLVLAGHLDTVHADDWTQEWAGADRAGPFVGHLIDEEIWARGVTDQKGGICSIIEAIRAVDRAGFRLRGPVTGLFVCDEESGQPGSGLSLGMRAAVGDLFEKRRPSPDFAVYTEPTTGASVQPLYRELIQRFNRGTISFMQVQSFLLDEYVGLGPEHPQRYGNVIHAEFARHVDIDPDHLHVLAGDAPDLDLECARYDRLVTRARVGLQILGIGGNGHLAFNEPGSSFESRTRVVRLTAATRADNARYFDGPDQAPSHAITQGIATIGQAVHLLVLAVGSSKSEAVRAALEGPVTSAVPASALRPHPRVTVLLDPLAARMTGFRTS